jgi:hypothetical protein
LNHLLVPFLWALGILCLLSYSTDTFSQTLENIQKKCGYEPRTHDYRKGSPTRGDFFIQDVKTKIWHQDKEWKNIIQWTAPKTKFVTLKVFFLKQKNPYAKSCIVSSERQCHTSEGVHECTIWIEDYYFNNWGDVRKYHIEIVQDKEIKAVKDYPQHKTSAAQNPESAWYLEPPEATLYMFYEDSLVPV